MTANSSSRSKPKTTLKKPLVREGTRLLRRPDGRAYVFVGGGFRRIEGAPGDVVEAVYRSCDGRRSADAIAREVAASLDGATTETVCAALIAALERAGVLVEADITPPAGLTTRDLDRQDRQIKYWAGFETAERSRYDFQLALKEASVGLIGMGGVGSIVALILAGSGVGRIVGADPDVVELSNLNRQVLYTEADIGRPKVEAAREQLGALNSDVEFEGRQVAIGGVAEAEEYVDGLDFIALTADYPPGALRRWVAQACAARRVPYAIYGAMLMGPLVSPFETPCYGCYEALMRQHDPDYGSLQQQASALPEVQSAPTFIGPIAAGLMTKDVVLYIAGAGRGPSVGSVLRFDPQTNACTALALERRDDCAYCGTEAPARLVEAPA
jgi:molybdopterin-synthase adenylyltransferase